MRGQIAAIMEVVPAKPETSHITGSARTNQSNSGARWCGTNDKWQMIMEVAAGGASFP